MAERETSAPAMDRPPATQGPRANTVVERKLDQLCACLDEAMSSSSSTTRLRGPGAEARLVAEIKARTDFLRSLLAAEGECHAGARPGYLAEAEARFSVLEATFDQWSRRALGAPAADDDDEEDYVYDGGDEGQGEAEEEDARSGSSCSCTHSCQEAAEGDGFSERDAERQAAETRNEKDGIAKKHEGDGTREDFTSDDIAKEREAAAAAAETTRKRTVQRRCWWRRGAAWCGAAGVVAAVAVVVGMAMELAAVAHHNVYVVPT